ncbi:MAG: hypothetical protein ABSG99_07740 [Sedimentisphaerales bacterium]
MITIYWHCLGMTKADKTFVAGALNELAQQLKDDPIKLPVNIKALGNDLAKEVYAMSNQIREQSSPFTYCAAKVIDILPSDFLPEGKILTYCHPDSYIAKAARREKPSTTKYGANHGFFSAVYKPNSKVIVWHEALHILGADDCYKEDNPTQKKLCCKLDGCIMEYNPPESTCENRPFLCDRNVKKLKEFAKKVEQARKGRMDSRLCGNDNYR